MLQTAALIMGVTGTGAGMVTLATFTAYGAYFDKKKALSLGITAAGSGFGVMIVPSLLRALFDNFDFSSAILLYGRLVAILLYAMLVAIRYVGHLLHCIGFKYIVYVSVSVYVYVHVSVTVYVYVH